MQSWALDLRRRGCSAVMIHQSGEGDTQGARIEAHFEKHRGFFRKDAEPFEARLDTGPHGGQVWTVNRLEAQRAQRIAELEAEGLSEE